MDLLKNLHIHTTVMHKDKIFSLIIVYQTEDVSEKSKEKICQLLETHGMLKSAEARSEVPEEPWENEPEEPDEPWEEEEDRYEEDEPGDEEATEGPGTGEYGDDDDDDDGDGPDHTEL